MLNYGLFAEIEENTELISNSRKNTFFKDSPLLKLNKDNKESD